ncbi:threonine ammonia-lyase [Clostridium estertheticum]|uniref:L-threonine dehydratase catabolic TdcB n=1 Tax=Clostridium estertheticum subsp. estertheticum TaxID=1552 RepID=A0A1J0GK39_9CLOT|nr:threonine ammonia-lyase [Clostridium estertheticum]APC41647.1 threonine ammonia-lyase [Clostridium estertheticum subsp. estertheticum]MBZ9616475.1 threonine ammonia-lyase [Clostridium estertheticum subsp. laramiense]WAG72204.1 threonine ammonia-lyase [Clostridium estertheticum]
MQKSALKSLSNRTLEDHFLEIQKAQANLNGVTLKTGLIYSDVFSNESGNSVYIKPENLQITGAFKLRGAYNKLCSLTSSERERGVIASSAGNHAQGVAYSAQKLGILATIVMPKTTPLIKVEATKSYGATVVLFGDCYDEAYTEAKRLEKEHNYVFVHPFDDLDVMYGQGTIACEIVEEIKDIDCILVPVGGGGLIAGIALAAKALNPSIKIIGVEPEGAKAMKDSIDCKKVVHLETVCTIADGVAVKKPGDLSFEIIRNYVDEIVTVSDFDIMESFLLLLEKHKLIAEASGALSFAGLKKIKEKGKKVACVLSGGNIDVVTISSMIDKGLVSRGRLFCFSLEMSDIPGELVKVSTILANACANVVKLDHNQFKTNDRFMQVQLEITVETNGHDHVNAIINALGKEGYKVNKIY